LEEAGAEEYGNDGTTEAYSDWQPEASAPDRSPLPVPPGRPIPFAPAPPSGSYWPVRFTGGQARIVAYAYGSATGTRLHGNWGAVFLAARGTTRYHVGIDLPATINDVVVACEAGVIVGWQNFLPASTGQLTRALLIEHDGSGIVVNYGELTPDSLSRTGLKVGMRVAAGQPVGFVGDTAMLHFETYVAGTTKNARWLKAEATPPPQLLNPTRYLLFLQDHGLPAPDGTGVRVQPAAAQPPTGLVGFAQRVLNVAEGERLAEDDTLGRNTRAALERFRTKYHLGPGSALDARTQIALAQRALEELKHQSLFGQLGSLDAATTDALAAFKSERRLSAGPDLDAATRAALRQALVKAGAPVTAPGRILQIATDAEIARYRWHDRGVAPKGYLKGMALTYARVYCKLKAGDAGAAEMAKADTGNGEVDALAHYAAEFRAVGLANDTAGADTLRHLFVLLTGLGMRESGGRYCTGRDRSAHNLSADTAEAGLFQTSFNARGASRLLPPLFRQYLAHPAGFLEVFRDGVRCSDADLENFGSGDGREFQRLSKECPAFAAEFAAIALRNRRKHWGPINRKTAEVRPEAEAMLLRIQQAVDQYELCPVVR
ncbi:M23 family metallopeptidase, partial [Paractinoplanes tereljensis]